MYIIGYACSLELLGNFLGFFLPLVPVPLVHLALSQSHLLCKIIHKILCPVRVLLVLVFQNLHLFFVFLEPHLRIPSISVLVVGDFHDEVNACVEVGEFSNRVVENGNVVLEFGDSHVLVSIFLRLLHDPLRLLDIDFDIRNSRGSNIRMLG